MSRLSIFILGVLLASNSLAASLSKPGKSDIESACRTLLYQVTKEKGNKEEIVVLNAAYKLICSEVISESLGLIHERFAKISAGLADSGACLDATGFVSARAAGGWTHREIERFYKFNDSTGGGWDHMEIERYSKLSPYINDLSDSELLGFKNLIQSGHELEKIKSTVELMNVQSYQQLQPKIQDLNNQLESLDLNSLRNIELNKQMQLTP